MRADFFDNIAGFSKRLKKESENFEGLQPFEQLMKGLSDGSVRFRWSFGGRLKPHIEPLVKPKAIWFRYILSAPIIYAMIIPIVTLDLAVSLYQMICFRLWKLPQVSRQKYVIIDRHRLEYLNWFERLNCVYCGYANGVMAYARQIAAETERYWCPVKHDEQVINPHDFYIEFADYGDAVNWDALELERRQQNEKKSG